jgi:hypothetical protein
MTWLKIATNLPAHDKLLDLAPDRCWFYVACLCFSAEHLTDGVIRPNRLRFVDVTFPDPELAIRDLVTAGLVEKTPDGWAIVNYLSHQRSAEQVKQQRLSGKERAQRSRTVRANATRTHAVTHDERSMHVREQSRGEENARITPIIPSHPQVIHRCEECDHVLTDFGCDCTPEDNS